MVTSTSMRGSRKVSWGVAKCFRSIRLAVLSLWIDSLLISFTGNKSTKIKAKQMAECDAELSAVLFSRQEKITKDDQPVREADAIRKRSVEFKLWT